MWGEFQRAHGALDVAKNQLKIARSGGAPARSAALKEWTPIAGFIGFTRLGLQHLRHACCLGRRRGH
jgi:hypothetical protein